MKQHFNFFNIVFHLALCSSLCFSIAGFCQDKLIVKTKTGYVKGGLEGRSLVFKGLPYAAAPVGSLRFKPPQAAKSWRDTLNCQEFGPMAAQFGAALSPLKGDEDCLRLNIYKPDITTKKKLPVVVWIHGGAMTGGSGMFQNGHAFSDRDSIITITINYRLGVFGFLYLGDLDPKLKTSGNNGLQDCIMALQWIKENISAFGGDVSRITVMGESAGAKLASTLLVSPMAKGKFQQLILESGSVQCIRDSVTAKEIRKRLMTILNIDHPAQLLNLPAEALIKAQALVCNGAAGTNYFGPVEDGMVIKGDPYEMISQQPDQQVKLLIGTNKEESVMFMQMDKRLYHPAPEVLNAWFGKNYPLVLTAYQDAIKAGSADSITVHILTQYMYQMHSYRLAEALAKAGREAWMYRFDYDQDGSPASHAKELSFIWSLDADKPDQGLDGRQKLAYQMHSAWVKFIKSGSPGQVNAHDWLPYQFDHKNVMLFDAISRPVLFETIFNDENYPSAGFILGN